MASVTTRRRAALSRDSVLAAAVEIADAEGIDAVTMRRLAEALGVHPTSIYNHLPSKEAILEGISETLFAEADMELVFADWREWVRSFADGMRRIARAHPGAFLVFSRVPAEGLLARRQAEAAIDAFRRGGFGPATAVECTQGISLAILGLAINECPTVGPTYAVDLSELSPDEFPRIFEVADADVDADRIWSRVIDALIVGLVP
jgi:AcrR family transcriptional regulator